MVTPTRARQPCEEHDAREKRTELIARACLEFFEGGSDDAAGAAAGDLGAVQDASVASTEGVILVFTGRLLLWSGAAAIRRAHAGSTLDGCAELGRGGLTERVVWGHLWRTVGGDD